MSKAWDILPPIPKPHKSFTKTEKKRSKNCSMFFFICFIIIVGIFIFQITNSPPPDINGINTTLPTANTSADTSSAVQIKILNGSGKAEETNKVSDLLTDADYKIAKKENALNLYDETIVYYQKEKKEIAENIADLLKSYGATTQQFTQSTSYDIVIVISAK